MHAAMRRPSAASAHRALVAAGLFASPRDAVAVAQAAALEAAEARGQAEKVRESLEAKVEELGYSADLPSSHLEGPGELVASHQEVLEAKEEKRGCLVDLPSSHPEDLGDLEELATSHLEEALGYSAGLP